MRASIVSFTTSVNRVYVRAVPPGRALDGERHLVPEEPRAVCIMELVRQL